MAAHKDAPKRIWLSRMSALNADRLDFHAHVTTYKMNDDDIEYTRTAASEGQQMITYKPIDKSTSIRVLLEGKAVGTIRPQYPGFRYYPRTGKEHGENFPSLEECKRSLEGTESQ